MAMKSSSNPLGPLPAAMRSRLRRAFARLVDPVERPAKAGRETAELTVAVGTLRAAGLTIADVRWLLDNHYLQWPAEKNRATDKPRVVGTRGTQAFSAKSRLLLTPAGFRVARLLLPDITYYDRELRELWAQGELVKRFTQPAPDQHAILSTFEESGWPRHIDDPLPHKRGRQAANLRLRDAIKRLNRHQQRSLLQFRGDGTGEGLRWEFVANPEG
jgi:hypothetical protein